MRAYRPYLENLDPEWKYSSTGPTWTCLPLSVGIVKDEVLEAGGVEEPPGKEERKKAGYIQIFPRMTSYNKFSMLLYFTENNFRIKCCTTILVSTEVK